MLDFDSTVLINAISPLLYILYLFLVSSRLKRNKLGRAKHGRHMALAPTSSVHCSPFIAFPR